MRLRPSIFAIFLAFTSVATLVHAHDRPHAITIPMQLELDRPYIDVTLIGSGGQAVRAHAWVDTGGGAVLFSAGLARELGLKPAGKPIHEEGHVLAPVDVPIVRIGGEQVTLVKGEAFIAIDEPKTLSGSDAQMQLPGRMLRDHVVTFDYPERTFTVAEKSHADMPGTPIKTSIGKSGMPVVWLSVAGKTEGFLLDTGGQFSMVSLAKLRDWAKRNPAWKHVTGAYGPANMLLAQETQGIMLRIGEMKWGPFAIHDAGAVSRPAGVYEKWMSQMLEQPVVGSIGGNVLRDFRITIDYPNGKVYLQRQSGTSHPPLAMVGLMLIPTPQGGYAIAGAAAGVQDIHPGDLLVTVDGQDVTGTPYFRVVAWLSGKPGEARTLGLIRDGKAMTVEATVHGVF